MNRKRLVMALACLALGLVLTWWWAVECGVWLPGGSVCQNGTIFVLLPAVIGILGCIGLLRPKTPPPPAWTPPPRLPRDEG